MIKIAPSLLSADFAAFGRAAENVENWGADYIHFDVMDGNFVPAITFGSAMCSAVKKHTSLPVDAHLMVMHPSLYIAEFASAGADIFTFHIEADVHAYNTLQRIRLAGMRAGIALNPATPICAVENVLPLCDLVLVMTVEPGAGGQRFIPSMLPKVEYLAREKAEKGYTYEIEVDGGITADNAKCVLGAGAEVLVSGSGVFRAADPRDAILKMRAAGDFFSRFDG